jgi:hypothetical protein
MNSSVRIPPTPAGLRFVVSIARLCPESLPPPRSGIRSDAARVEFLPPHDRVQAPKGTMVAASLFSTHRHNPATAL